MNIYGEPIKRLSALTQQIRGRTYAWEKYV